MENQIAEFWTTLLVAGISTEDAASRSYDYALALCVGQLPEKTTHVSAKLMLHAAGSCVKAKPIAYRNYDNHFKMR